MATSTLRRRLFECGSWNQSIQETAVVSNIVGGAISPLLANIVLNKLDWRLEAQGYRFVRYADDFVVVCKTRHEATTALELVEDENQRLNSTTLQSRRKSD